MTTVNDVMTRGATCVQQGETLVEAARLMRELEVGALPICGDDGKLAGMLTDRDIVVKCLSHGGDPRVTTAGELAEGTPVWVGVGDDTDDVRELMERHQIRRVPVIDGDRLVGIVSQADVARHLDPHDVGSTVEAISQD